MKGNLKKTAVLLMSLVLLCGCVLPCFAAVKGDVDGDGVLSLNDAQLVFDIVSKVKKGTSAQLKAADYNGDGKVNLIDAEQMFEIATQSDMGLFVKNMEDAGFPSSYIQYLKALHIKYPKWSFEPFITGLDWNTAVIGERSSITWDYNTQKITKFTPYHRKQLIENNVSSADKCNCSSCNGVIFEGPCWVSASQSAVEYYMDPRNFLTEEYIFQFESTAYSNAMTVSGVEGILAGTWMSNAYITYLDSDGASQYYTENGNKVKYSEAILKAAKDSGMSAYYLASKIYQEVGGKTASAAGASGNSSYPFKGIYNYYNIGAYTGARDGLEWANGYMEARTSAPMYATASTTASLTVTVPVGTELYYKSAAGNFYKVSATVSGKSYTGFVPKSNVTIETTYGRPWTNPYKSIYYGAIYINNGFGEYQFTGYLQKFNVNPASGTSLYSHEYMGNVRGAASESKSTYNAYKAAGILETEKVFSIPVFKNMPGMSIEESFPTTAPVVSCTAADNSSVTLSWTEVKGADGYKVYKLDPSNGYYSHIATVAVRTYKAPLASGTSGTYKVYGYYCDEAGNTVYSGLSNAVTATATAASTTKTGKAYNLDGDPLNIRKGPGTSYDRITQGGNPVQLYEGDTVTIVDGPTNNWYHVKFTKNGTAYEGYASADYIKIV